MKTVKKRKSRGPALPPGGLVVYKAVYAFKTFVCDKKTGMPVIDSTGSVVLKQDAGGRIRWQPQVVKLWVPPTARIRYADKRDSAGFRVDRTSGVSTVKEFLKKRSVRNSNTKWQDKLRVSEAIVLQGEGVSSHDRLFWYRRGSVVRPHRPFTSTNMQCASGIHCFLTYEGAKDFL